MPIPGPAQNLLDEIGTGPMTLDQLKRLLPRAQKLSPPGKAYVLHHLLRAKCKVREMQLAQRQDQALIRLAQQTEYDADAALIALSAVPNKLPGPAGEPRKIEVTEDTEVSVLTTVGWIDVVLQRIGETLSMPPDPALDAQLRRVLDWVPVKQLNLRMQIVDIIGDTTLRATVIADRIQAEAAKGPLSQAELRLILAAAPEDWPAMMRATNRQESMLLGDGDPAPHALLKAPGYLDFAQQTLAFAHQHLADIHSGKVDFAPDKAFTLDDNHALARIVSLGLATDAPWCREHLRDIWLMAAEAPDPKKKSAPSQSLTIACGHAAVAHPLPYAVAALAEVLASVRHAGLEKKLKKAMRAAETAMAARPDLVTQLPADQPIPPKLKKGVQRSVEHLLKLPDFMDQATFHARLLDRKELSESVQGLIWETEDGATLRPTKTGWQDVAGSAVTLDPDTGLRLWHPVEAMPELRDAWRGALMRDGITQPFAQAHREHYRPPDESLRTTQAHLFAETDIVTTRIVAVAQGLGLVLDDGAYLFTIGTWTFTQPMGTEHLYPGSQSSGRMGPLTLTTPGAKLADVPPRVLSEVLRTVDLLASLGTADYDTLEAHAPAKSPFHKPGHQTIQMRRQVLGWTFKGAAETGRLSFQRNHAIVGDLRVHLATGRATRSGDPVPLPAPKNLPPLPYRDETLQKVARHLAAALNG